MYIYIYITETDYRLETDICVWKH